MIASFFATYIYMGLISLNMRPLRGRFSQYPDPGGVTSLLLFGPWRHKMFQCTLWSLAG
jgi:hypothetical protein